MVELRPPATVCTAGPNGTRSRDRPRCLVQRGAPRDPDTTVHSAGTTALTVRSPPVGTEIQRRPSWTAAWIGRDGDASSRQPRPPKACARAARCLGSVASNATAVSYTHLRAHETVLDLVCRLLLE